MKAALVLVAVMVVAVCHAMDGTRFPRLKGASGSKDHPSILRRESLLEGELDQQAQREAEKFRQLEESRGRRKQETAAWLERATAEHASITLELEQLCDTAESDYWDRACGWEASLSPGEMADGFPDCPVGACKVVCQTYQQEQLLKLCVFNHQIRSAKYNQEQLRAPVVQAERLVRSSDLKLLNAKQRVRAQLLETQEESNPDLKQLIATDPAVVRAKRAARLARQSLLEAQATLGDQTAQLDEEIANAKQNIRLVPTRAPTLLPSLKKGSYQPIPTNPPSLTLDLSSDAHLPRPLSALNPDLVRSSHGRGLRRHFLNPLDSRRDDDDAPTMAKFLSSSHEEDAN